LLTGVGVVHDSGVQSPRRRSAVALLLSFLASTVGESAAPSAPGHEASGFEATVKPFLARNCALCHNPKLRNADVNLHEQVADSLQRDRELWERVLGKLSTGEMPPPGMPRPDPAQVKAVTAWLEAEFESADAALPPDPGRVTARRLNRAEYDNTVRDLLGVDLRLGDTFPQDDSGYGFDNIGDVLSLSPVLMEKYVAAAEKIARTALHGVEPMPPTVKRYQPAYRKKADGDVIVYQGRQAYTITDYDVTGLTLPMAIHASHRFPADAEYLFRVTPEGRRPRGSEPVQVALWMDGKVAKVIEIDATDLEGQTREFRLRASAGDHDLSVSFLRQFEGMPAAFGGLNPSKRSVPPPDPPRKPPENATPEQLAEYTRRLEAFKKRKEPWDSFRINFLEIGGPFEPTVGPSRASLEKIFVCGHPPAGPHGRGCQRQIVENLAHRAFRRPVTEAESTRLVALADAARKRSGSFEDGIGQALQTMLVSPHFLFRMEAGRAGDSAPHPISEHELASRLSYFLWSTMPDEDLLRAADAGELRRPGVLEAQVRRMLKSEKVRALAENFAGQWLQFRALESVTPDRERFPDFEDYLRTCMRRETELFFGAVVHEDRSILEFIDADYTFLNERLALHYGVDGVKGPEFRRVALPGRERGGILTQASVLTVSSYATRTSPVLRGKWVLENLLNAPPPDPPPGVPRLDEEKIGTAASLRQQLEAHRKNATCASCHVRMDPLGFGLENYDAIGAWRTQDGPFPIDASGKLPDGRAFAGPAELKQVLMGDKPVFAQALTDKMLTYALGRGLERADRRTVKAIAGRVAETDYRFSSLVLEIVNSLPFQMRRGERGPT
jgi:mono/diheme cytochrome c family protein